MVESVLILLGATGVGKSELALDWARKTGGALLVADSMQVYRGADIGTSKPSKSEQEQVPHGGLDLVEVGAPFSVASYLEAAAAFLTRCKADGKPVLVVAGTGLYARALREGLCEAPQVPALLRAELGALALPELQKRLQKADPEMAFKIDLQNPRRVLRALEVIESTGRSLLWWQKQNQPALVPQAPLFWLQRPKEVLHERIAARVETMVAAGWIEEVRRLLAVHGHEVVSRFAAIGYREIAAWIAQGSSLEAWPSVQASIAQATRAYAKRQVTWFRSEPQAMPLAVETEACRAKALTALEPVS